MNVQPNGNLYNVQLRICRRRLQKKAVPYTGMLEVLLSAPQQKAHHRRFRFQLNGDTTWVNLQTAFIPQACILDPDEKICDAAVTNTQVVRAAGRYEFNQTAFTLLVNQLNDSATVQLACVHTEPYFSNSSQPELVPPIAFWTINGSMPLQWIAQGHFTINPDDYFSSETLKTIASEEKPMRLGMFHRNNSTALWTLLFEIEEPKQYTPGNIPLFAIKPGEYSLFYYR